jgi:peptidoglycan-associated lipoprotein
LKGVALKEKVMNMSLSSCRNLNLLAVLTAACILAACTTTKTGTEDGVTAETESPVQVEPEPAEVIEPQEDQAETLQLETQTQIEAAPTLLEADPAGEIASDEIAQTDGVEEMAVFPEQEYAVEEPLEFDSGSNAEIDRLRDELAASEAELERSRAREEEAERSRSLEAELERSRALEAELESSRALESEAEQNRALEAAQIRSRELEAELQRSRAQEAEAERNRTLEAELERSRELEAGAERSRELEAELERSRELEAEAEAEYQRSLASEADTGFDSEQPYSAFAESDETESAMDEEDAGLPAYTAMAQASEDPESDAAEMTSYPPGKPAEYSIYFDYNQAMLQLEFEPTLMKHAEYLKANPDLNVEIQGNCDERGSREYNIALGVRRALTVKRALELLGVAGYRIEILSFGAEKPIAFGHDDESWRLNRRADIIY